jgi:hypothetical protein
MSYMHACLLNYINLCMRRDHYILLNIIIADGLVQVYDSLDTPEVSYKDLYLTMGR